MLQHTTVTTFRTRAQADPAHSRSGCASSQWAQGSGPGRPRTLQQTRLSLVGHETISKSLMRKGATLSSSKGASLAIGTTSLLAGLDRGFSIRLDAKKNGNRSHEKNATVKIFARPESKNFCLRQLVKSSLQRSSRSLKKRYLFLFGNAPIWRGLARKNSQSFSYQSYQSTLLFILEVVYTCVTHTM